MRTRYLDLLERAFPAIQEEAIPRPLSTTQEDDDDRDTGSIGDAISSAPVPYVINAVYVETTPDVINAVYVEMPGPRCNWPGCHEPVRLVHLHDGTEEQQCGYSHPQGWEPSTILPEPSGPPPMAPTDDTGEQRVVDYLERGKPLLPCRVCQRDVWEESDPGVWRCQRCGTAERERAEVRAELLMWAEAHQWPRLSLAEGTAVPSGEAHWQITVGQGSARSLAAIAAAVTAAIGG